MSDSAAPRISFVVATDTFATVADVLASLRDQPDPDGIELVLACPSAAGLGESEAAPAGPLRIVEVGELVPIEEAFAAGIRAASAPVVLVGETHAFPEPGALEPLIRAICDDGYAAVAPGLRNANPETAASWASLMVTYGWSLGGSRREMSDLSTHNTAYRRELLLAFGDELPALLRLGGGIHGRLRAQGHRLLIEPASVFAHLNVVRFRSCLGDRFHAARCYTSSRSESWSKDAAPGLCSRVTPDPAGDGHTGRPLSRVEGPPRGVHPGHVPTPGRQPRRSRRRRARRLRGRCGQLAGADRGVRGSPGAPFLTCNSSVSGRSDAARSRGRCISPC